MYVYYSAGSLNINVGRVLEPEVRLRVSLVLGRRLNAQAVSYKHLFNGFTYEQLRLTLISEVI